MDVQLDEEIHSLSGVWAITIPSGVVHGIQVNLDAKGAVPSLAAPLFSRRDLSAITALFRRPDRIGKDH